MLFKVGRMVTISVRPVKGEIAISLKGLSDNSGLRCANLRMRGASVESNTVLPVRSASSTMEGNAGDNAASSHRDSVSWRTPALEFLPIVWTKREMTREAGLDGL
jgi:hypothetical protein